MVIFFNTHPVDVCVEGHDGEFLSETVVESFVSSYSLGAEYWIKYDP